MLTLLVMVLGFWATTATGVSWALPMPSLSSVHTFFTGAIQAGFGGADGRTHLVGASATRTGAGAVGHAPGTAPGQLPAYSPKRAPKSTGTSGPSPLGPTHGFDAKTSVFDPHKSSASQDVFDNADGSVSVKDYQASVNYRKPDGTWAKINDELTRAAGGRIVETAAASGPSFAPSAAGPNLSTYSFGPGESVSFGLVGASAVPPALSGDTATYSGVLPDVNLELEALPYGAKESVELTSPSAPTSFTYTMALTGVTASLAADGSVSFEDSSGRVVGEVPHGTMAAANVSTASHQAPSSDGVTYTLGRAGSGQTLTMSLDASWLHASGRAYPVTVDPTVYGSPDIDASSGTYAMNLGSNNNSTDSVLKVGYCDVDDDSYCGQTDQSDAFLSFPNVGTAYKNDVIDSASLNLDDVWAETCTAKAFSVAAVTQSWTASTPVAYPGYSYGGQIGSATLNPGSACVTATGSGTWMAVSLAPATFNGWTGGTGTNYGLAVYAAQTDGTWKQFASLNTANPPYLLLTYQANTAPSITAENPPSGQSLQTLTPELTATAWDPDSFPGKSLQYEFQVLDDSTGTPVQVADSGTLTEATSTSSGAWTVPSGTLTWSGDFSWEVRVSDQLGWSPWSQASYFNLAVTQPAVTSELGGTNSGNGYNALVGNYTAQATDANLSVVGPPLTVQRTYNSLDPRVALAFGSGWSSVLDSSAEADSDGSGNVVVSYANGQQMRFGANADGSFSAPSGTYAVLTAAPSTAVPGSYCPALGVGYCLVDKTGTTYAYTHAKFVSTSGSVPYELSAVFDPQGHATLFGYTYSNMYGAQLTSMTSCVSGCLGTSPVTSRSLSFTWSVGSGSVFSHVAKVTSNPVSGAGASSDLVWTYSYNGNELTAVCDPTEQAGGCGQETKYSYESGSQFSSAMLDAGPESYWRLGDAAGSTTAADQILANEGTDNGTPTGVTFGNLSQQAGPSGGPADGPLNTGEPVGQFNGTSSQVLLPDSLVTGQTYLSIGLWFRTSQPGILFAEQNQPMGSATTPSNATASLYVGTDGKLHGAWYTGGTTSAYQAVSTNTVTDGAWHYVVLSAAGTAQTLYLDGAVACSTGCTVTGQINNLSQTAAYVGAGFSSGAWPAESTRGYDYFNGEIAEVAFYPRALGATTVQEQYSAAQFASALLTSITKPSGAVQASAQYDAANNRVTQATDADGAVYNLNPPTVSGSSNAYVGAVLGSAPQGYWRLNTLVGSSIFLGGEVSSGAADNKVTQHSVTTTLGSCTQVFICTPPLNVRTDPQGDGVYNNVTLGATNSSPFSDSGGAQFDGVTSYVQLPGDELPASGPMAVELWFNSTTSSGMLLADQSFALGGTSGTMIANLYIGSDGKLHGQFWSGSASSTMSSPATVTDGNWHYVVLSTDGADQQLYLDGSQVASETTTTPVSTESQPYVYVGAGTSGGGWPALPALSQEYFKGSISDVAVYGHALSGQDVAEHFAELGSSSGLNPVESTAVDGPLGRPLITTYDPMQGGRVLSSTDADGGTTLYGYDSGGFLNTVTDPLGDVTTTGHDVRGNEISKTSCQDQAAQECSTSYYTYWPDDQTAQLSPDPRDDLETSSRDPRSSGPSDPTYMTQYAYDTYGDLISTTDPLGRSTTDTYTVGTEAAIAAPASTSTAAACTAASTTSGVTPAGLLLTSSTPSGALTTYAYYADGDLAVETNPLGGKTIYVYDGVGRVSFKTQCSDTFPDGVVTSYVYDGDGRVAEETAPATTDAVTGVAHEQATQTWYRPDGQVDHATVSDADGVDTTRTTTYTYYPSGLVETVTDPAGATTSYTYDAEGDKTGETDPNGDVWVYAYNGDGQQISTTLTNYSGSATGTCQPNSGQLVTASKAYDLAGRLASDVDAMCRETAYTYYDDGLTATVTQVSPSPSSSEPSVVETKTYDASGNVVSDVTGNGLAATLTSYDAAGQVVLSRVQYSTNPSGTPLYKNTQTSYTPDGKPASVSKWQDDGSGTVETTDYTYNALGDMLSQTEHDSNTAQAAAVDLDGAWNLTDGSTLSAKDGSGGDLPAALSGGTSWSQDAPAGLSGSLQFDGSTGQAETTGVAVDTSKNYSVSAWAKLYAAPNGFQTIVSETGTSTNAFYLQYNPQVNGWRLVTNGSNSTSATQYSAHQSTVSAVGSWTHLVGTYNSGTKALTLYVNGVLAGTVTAATAWSATGVVTIGSAGGKNFTDGEVADVQLWNRTLSQADVDQLYNGVSPGSQGLAGSWRLSDGSTVNAADSSGHDNPATATGGVTWNSGRGGAAGFDGSTGYLSTGATPVLNTTGSFTVGAWVDLTSTAGWNTAVSQPGTKGSAFFLQYNAADGDWGFDRDLTDTAAPTLVGAQSSAAPTLNTWTYLTGVYNAGTGLMQLYVNGVLQSTTATDTTSFASQGGLYIGRALFNGSPTDFWHGSISGVQAYGQALTGTQIATLYNGGSLLAPSTVMKTTWTYDERGVMTSMTEPMGNAQGAAPGSYTTTYVSDQLGRLTETVQPAINTQVDGGSPTLTDPTTLTGYDTFGDKVESQDANGNITATSYDADGRPTGTTLPSYTQPISGGQTFTATSHTDYNPDGTVKDTIDPAGNETSYTYDQFDDQISQTNPAIVFNGAPTQGTSTAEYDQDGEQIESVDPSGAEVDAQYNYLGQQSEQIVDVRQPSAATVKDETLMAYDPLGDLTQETSPTGVVTQATYDNAGEQTSSTDGAGNVTHYSYDLDGRPVSTGNPDGTWTWNAYDLAGDPTYTADFSATNSSSPVRTQSSGYDLDGEQTWTSDYMGNVTDFGYDADGNLVAQSEPVAANSSIYTSYGYDGNGNRTAAVSGNQNTTVYTYNSWGLPESTVLPATTGYTSAASRTSTLVYDEDGNAVEQVEPGGVTVNNTYDALGDLTQQTGAGADVPTATRSFGYDLDQDVTLASTGTAGNQAATSDSFTYDDAGDLLSASGTSGTSSFAYNQSGQMTSRNDASSWTPTTYGYDPTSGLLTSVTDPLNGIQDQYSYNSMDQVKSINYGGTSDDTRSFTYDNLDRLKGDTLDTASGSQVAAIDYQYNNDDEEIQQTTWGIGTTSASTDVVNTYQYDDAGRLTSWNNGSTTVAYTYDGDGNRRSVGSKTYQYNARDQLVNDGTHTYGYDADGTLSSETTTATGSDEVFAYDAYQQMATDAGTSYTYDALGRTTSAGSTALQYSGQGNDVASDGNAAYTHDPDGAVVGAWSPGGGSEVTWTDQHDNLVAQFTPSAGGLSEWQTFDPLGDVASSVNWSVSLGYQSGYTSGGKVNMDSRWYSPASGQFDSADTQSNSPNPTSVNANQYAYANDNPMTGTDSSGHGAVGINLGNDGNVCSPSWDPLCALLNGVLGGTTAGCDTSTCSCPTYGTYCGYDPFCQTTAPYGAQYCGGPVNSGPPWCQSVAPRGARYCGNQPSGPPSPGPGHPKPTKPLPPPCPEWKCDKNPNAPHCKSILGIVCLAAPLAGLATIIGTAFVPEIAIPAEVGIGIGIGTSIDEDPDDEPTDDDQCQADDAGAPVLADLFGVAPWPSADCDKKHQQTPCDTSTTTDGANEYYGLQEYTMSNGKAGCRATGAHAILDQANRRSRNSATIPLCPTCEVLRSIQKGWTGWNAGHLIGYAMGGSGRTIKNLVPMYPDANQQDMADIVEAPVWKAMDSGAMVEVDVDAHYPNDSTNIPDYIDYWYEIYNKNGSIQRVQCVVYNTPVRGSAKC